MSTRGSVRRASPLARAAARAEESLAATDLAGQLRSYLPAAADVVARRLVAAAHREGLTAGAEWTGPTAFLPLADGGVLVTRARRHAFDRIELDEPLHLDPALLLDRLLGADRAAPAVAAELTDATVNLALAYARRARLDADLRLAAVAAAARDSLDLGAGLDPDMFGWHLERLATEGHNLHPCGRTRLGWSVPDVLRYDLEAATVPVGFVAVRRDLHLGDDIGADLLDDTGVDPARYAVTPVHPWQRDVLLPRRYGDLLADGALVPLAARLPARPTAALRTLLLDEAVGVARYLKLSLDIQVTSTRRSISVASTRNGPELSRLISELLAEDPAGERVVLLPETAGAAAWMPAGDRDLSAIVRGGLTGRLVPGELPVPGGALTAISPVTGTTVLAELVSRYADTRGGDRAAAAAGFVAEYARLLLVPVLTLATRYGLAIEAHLQNCVPTFVDGVPHRLGLRDLAGLRLYPARLDRAVDIWPGSVVRTDTVDVMRAKVAYTALQAHLGEVVLRLAGSHGLDERAAWSGVRALVDEVYDGLRRDPALAARAADDHAFLTAPTVPQKALLSMRLADARGEAGDRYVPVRNPLR